MDIKVTFTCVWKNASGVFSTNSVWTGVSEADGAAIQAAFAPVGTKLGESSRSGDRYLVLSSTIDGVTAPAIVIESDKVGLEAVEEAGIAAQQAMLAYGKAQPA